MLVAHAVATLLAFAVTAASARAEAQTSSAWPPSGAAQVATAPAGAPLPPDAGPEYMPYVEMAPAPTGYVLEKRTRKWAVVVGSIGFGAPYLAGLAAVNESGNENAAWMALPVLGPLALLAADRDHCIPNCLRSLTPIVLIGDSLLQGAAASLFVWGLVDKRKRWVREGPFERPRFSLIPQRMGTGFGLGAHLLF